MDITDYRFSLEELAVTWSDFLTISPEESRGMDAFPEWVDEVMQAAAPALTAIGGYRILPLTEASIDYLTIEGQRFETGRIIAKPLQQADHLAVFACTAGPVIRQLYDRYRREEDPLKAFIADTLGTVVVEKAMDKVQAYLEAEVSQQGWLITNRYSPGYCGWHVSEQQKLWTLLPTGFGGISLTPSSLMLPEKSVSGFIGLGPHVRKVGYACHRCDMEHCLYRRRRLTTSD